MGPFADYIYTQPGIRARGYPEYMPGINNGEWDFVVTSGRHFDKDKFEAFKTRFYQFQGWDTKTGFPTRKALESLDLEGVADELEKNGKLGTAKV
jgi:aldehyde:ferredoxin oxidoreductase